MTAPFATLNGMRVTAGSITVPTYGPWSGDVSLVLEDPLPTAGKAITLTFGNLSLVGTVFRQASFAGTTTVRLVGGAGGWRQTVPAQHYQSSALSLSLLIGDAAKSVGETVTFGPGVDAVIGADYVREEAPAEEVIRQLYGTAWWIAPDGTTVIGPRAGGLVPTPFQAEEWIGAKGQFTVATEDYAAWLPGATFTGPTIPTTQTVATTSFVVDNDGLFRLTVLSADGAGLDRLIRPINEVIKAAAPKLTYSTLYKYTVEAVSGAPPNVTVDLSPASSLSLPSLRNIRIMPSAMGGVAIPSLGATAVVAFLNGDPTEPFVLSVDATVVQAEIDASALVRVQTPSMLVGPAPEPLCHSPAMLAIIAELEGVNVAVETMADSLAALAGAMATTTHAPPALSFNTFAAAVNPLATTMATDATAASAAIAAAAIAIAAETPLVPTIVLEGT